MLNLAKRQILHSSIRIVIAVAVADADDRYDLDETRKKSCK